MQHDTVRLYIQSFLSSSRARLWLSPPASESCTASHLRIELDRYANRRWRQRRPAVERYNVIHIRSAPVHVQSAACAAVKTLQGGILMNAGWNLNRCASSLHRVACGSCPAVKALSSGHTSVACVQARAIRESVAGSQTGRQAPSVMSSSRLAVSQRREWEDPTTFAIGQRSSHVPLHSFANEAEAVDSLTSIGRSVQESLSLKADGNICDLCGMWDFQLFDRPEDVPEDFWTLESSATQPWHQVCICLSSCLHQSGSWSHRTDVLRQCLVPRLCAAIMKM